jgi:hypothetical protein
MLSAKTGRIGRARYWGIMFIVLIIHAYTAYGQKGDEFTLYGTIYNSSTGTPVAAGSVFIVEIKKITAVDANGKYAISVPKPGRYTLIVQSEGLKALREKIDINASVTKDFALGGSTAMDRGITITGKREMQKVSRHTMTRQQIKDVPASFGDSINAIASLPGVIRTGGDLFGPIVIRGGDYRGVRYLVDDIPVHSPLHYGGLHSIINTNLIREISVLSSGFPAEIGSATAAVISMSTVDSVKEFGGYVDLSILSAALLVQTPIMRDENGGISLGSPLERGTKGGRNAGYIIASGRMGYIDLIVLPLLKFVLGEHINVVPKYWDYQFKAKYIFNKRHSLALFALGSKDYFKFVNTYYWDKDSDPLISGARLNVDQQTHGQSLNYTYKISQKFHNSIIAYTSLKQSHASFNLPAPGVNVALKGISLDSRPYLFGCSDKFKVTAVKNILEIRGGVEYNFYYFLAKGRRADTVGGGLTSDISESNIVPVPVNERILNSMLGGYVETKITYNGFTFMPGFRSDYLYRSGEATWDPRGLISYEFSTGTTISAAAGKYSGFFQTNPMFFDARPQYARIRKHGRSEWSLHRVVGLEQVIGLFKIKAESFYNEFYNIVQSYIHFAADGSYQQTMSRGKIRAYGAEIMLKKDRKENENSLFGWVSYTYTRSQFKSGLPYYDGLYGNPLNTVGDYWGSSWINYDHEQNHSLKLIAGYAYNQHTFTGKFQLFTSQPYTPIMFGQEDMQFFANTGGHRYYPVFGRPNSRHFPINHRLDVRYSYTSTYSWGYVSWYVEIINVLNHRPIAIQSWNYWLPYHPQIPYLHSQNPRLTTSRFEIAFIPNFGVEVKF